MKKRWAIAGAGATLGALLFVKVDEGSVRLSSAREDLTLGAGQAATVGSDGLVRVATEGLGASALPSVPAEPATHPQHGAKPIAPEAQRLRERVLDSLRARQQPNAAETAASKPAPGTHAPGTMADRTGELGQETMRVLNHEFIPLVDDCYDQARERNPRLRGMLALTVELAAAEDVGSIFETVEPAQDRNQIHDEELIDCVRQSAFSIQLPAPVKSGRTSLQLTIPLAAPGATVDAGR